MKKFFIIALIISSFFIGILGSTDSTKVMAQNSTASPLDEAFNSKAANTRLLLNTLLHEHTVLAITTLKTFYKGDDTTKLESLMIDNQNQLADIIEKAYGKSVRDSFVNLWSAHMKEYYNYTIAKRSNNVSGMSTARHNLQTIATSLGNLLQGKSLTATTVSTLMNEHITGTLSYVDAMASGNMTEEATLMKQGYDQAGKFADTLTRGIILDKPSLFQ